MKIGYLGYGRMGKAIESLALRQGHETGIIVSRSNPLKNADQLSGIDIALDFSLPDTAASHIAIALQAGIPIVSGTTGWLDKKQEVDALCRQLDGAFLYASNFSIGMNIFFRLNKQLAKLCSRFPQYAASVHEVHHAGKADKPSGTAISIADGLIALSNRYRDWQLNPADPPAHDILPVHAKREGDVKGRHIVEWSGIHDCISLTHEAFSRDAFAEGALQAAEWLRDKRGVFSFEDMLETIDP